MEFVETTTVRGSGDRPKPEPQRRDQARRPYSNLIAQPIHYGINEVLGFLFVLTADDGWTEAARYTNHPSQFTIKVVDREPSFVALSALDVDWITSLMCPVFREACYHRPAQ